MGWDQSLDLSTASDFKLQHLLVRGESELACNDQSYYKSKTQTSHEVEGFGPYCEIRGGNIAIETSLVAKTLGFKRG